METDPDRPSLVSIRKRKSVFPVIPKNEVALSEGASRHDLNRVATAGVCLNNGHQFFIRGLPDPEALHQNLCRAETNGYSGTDVTVKIGTSFEFV